MNRKIKSENFPFKKQYVIYHNDMDGKAAAFLVHRIVQSQFEWPDTTAQYQKFEHDGSDFNLNYVDKSTILYIVDVSFTKTEESFERLKRACETAGMVVWIDHHASSLDFVEIHKEWLHKQNIFWYIDKTACGALLTYAFSCLDNSRLYELKGHGNDLISFTFNYQDSDNSWFRCKPTITGFCYAIDKGIPKWLNLLDDYDRMQRRYVSETDRFILGCDINNTAIGIPEGNGKSRKIIFNTFWSNLTTNPRAHLAYINNGRLIQSYLTSRYTREVNMGMFEYTLPDGTVLCAINSRGNSWCFQENYWKYDGCILFSLCANGMWKYSVYSHDNSSFNCAKFCEEHGGGGHFHAAGFNSDKLIFKES